MKNWRSACLLFAFCSAFLYVGVAEAATVVTEGNITADTTWSASESPYVINVPITVATGTTLSIEPGASIKMLGLSGITVHGSLHALGTAEAPIRFTSKHDDSAAGDTNGNATSTVPGSEDWRSIRFASGSEGMFENASFAYAGFGNRRNEPLPAILNEGGSVTVRSSTFADNAMFHIGQTDGQLVLSNSTITGGSYGIGIKAGDADVSDNRFENIGYGILLDGSGTFSLTNNTFTGVNTAVDIRLTNGPELIQSGNSASGGHHNGIVLRGNIQESVTLSGMDAMPFIVSDAGGSSAGNGTLTFDQPAGLTIEESGALMFGPGAVMKMQGSSEVLVEGTLAASGTDDAPVVFTSLYDASVLGGTWDVDEQTAASEDWGHVRIVSGGTATFANSQIRYGGESRHRSGSALFNESGTLSVIESTIIENGQTGIRHESGTTTVSESNISGHSSYGVLNESVVPLDARNNYWGDASGPRHSVENPTGFGNAVSDNVLFAPWKGTYCAEACHSNVVFLPGIKGSVLKMRNLITSDTLWPAGFDDFDNDIEHLALNEDGTSVHEVYVDGVLQDYYGHDVYGPFSSYMDEMVSDGHINSWTPLAYDWRYGPEYILEHGVQTATTTLDLIEQIESAAANSKTGKVTIVAHSMGGLMGKAIIKELESQGKDGVIDSFVMVGSPQLGTPQAITSLLHGDGEGIPSSNDYRGFLNGVVVGPQEIRFVAQNMNSSYNLLPSAEYFSRVGTPIIILDALSQHTSDWYGHWGYALNDHNAMIEFLSGNGVARAAPAYEDLNTPSILRADLLAKANAFHAMSDSYDIPDSIEVIEIVGWGLPTVDGVLYTEEHGALAYKPQFTREGDGVVVYGSADAYDDAVTYYFEQESFKSATGQKPEHAYMLGMEPIQELLSTLLTNEPVSEIEYISTEKPTVTNLDDMLLVSAHSPVLLGVHDEDGNFTGTDGDEMFEEIPGSHYLVFGESQYIFVPEGGEYTFTYEGIDTGLTTIEIADVADDEIELVAAYTDIPTSLGTKATFLVQEDIATTVIALDEDGNGEVDLQVSADGAIIEEDNTSEEESTNGSSSGGGKRISLKPTPIVAGAATSSKLLQQQELIQLLKQLILLLQQQLALRG